MQPTNQQLLQWINHPETADYFGKAFKLKAAVLTALVTGSSLADVARRHGVTRQAASKEARRAKALFAATNS
jgi:transposase-like protein